MHVSLRLVESGDLPILFAHQMDPVAAQLAAFPSRDREAFFAHWTKNILGNPAAISCAILEGGRVVGHIGAWTLATSNERFTGYWIGREFWGRGIASAAMLQFLRWESTRPLIASVARHNPGSIRVLEKAGFVRVGDDSYSLPGGARVEGFLYSLGA